MTFAEAVEVIRQCAAESRAFGDDYMEALETMAEEWDQDYVDRLNALYHTPEDIPEETVFILFFNRGNKNTNWRIIWRKGIERGHASGWID